MNTREKIIYESLNLFSRRGFDAISVRDIAKAVGIKASSLYNHFKNKKEIFDTIIEKYSENATYFINCILTKYYSKEGTINKLNTISDEQFFKSSIDVFHFYLCDEYMVKFRKLLTIEQFNNSNLSDLYNKIFIDDILNFQADVFKTFMDADILVKKDPYTLALQFYSPAFLLFNKFEKITEKERVSLKSHIIQFKDTYTMRE